MLVAPRVKKLHATVSGGLERRQEQAGAIADELQLDQPGLGLVLGGGAGREVDLRGRGGESSTQQPWR